MGSTSTPNRPANYNARMSASGWGEIYVKVMTIGHGMSVISSESTTRFGNTTYVEAVTGGSFTLDLICSSYTEWERLGLWIRGYGRKVADPAGGVGPVRVECGVRNFDKVAIPSLAEFGDAVKPATYRTSIRFLGARDPVPLTSEFTSNFVLPASTDESLPYYYPAGTQLSGSGKGDDALYNYPPEVPGSGYIPITSPSNPQQAKPPTITSPSNPQQNYGE